MTTWCRATLNYVRSAGLSAGGLVPVEVAIRDGRTATLPAWSECGFGLVDSSSSVTDWTNNEEIASVHYGEAEALARRVTGCDIALVSDHVTRRAATKRGREQDPVRLVHSDFAADYEPIVRTSYREVSGRGAATLARTGVTSADIEHASRLVMLQVWRNLGAPKPDLPVAWCDARTVSPADARPFRYTGYVAGGRAFDALAIVAPADPGHHRWYGFPELTPQEAVVFRTYDTALVRDNRTWFTPHSAFRDPAVAEGNPGRFSVELRVMCLFG